MVINFLKETTDMIEKSGFTLNEIGWVGVRERNGDKQKTYRMNIDSFLKEADFEYNNRAYGKIHINPNLEIAVWNPKSCMLFGRVLMPLWIEKWEVYKKGGFQGPCMKNGKAQKASFLNSQSIFKRFRLTIKYTPRKDLNIRTDRIDSRNICNPSDKTMDIFKTNSSMRKVPRTQSFPIQSPHMLSG